MILNIHHSTIYNYLEPVQMSLQILRLTPFNNARQKVIRWNLQTPGKPSQHNDWFGNTTHVLNIPEALDKIEITATGQVEVSPAMPNPELGLLPAVYYLRITPLTDSNQNMKDLALSVNQNPEIPLGEQTAEVILRTLTLLSKLILQKVPYIRGVTNAATTAIGAIATAGGVCQDHAHIFLACCRYLGIPSRYVSGYLHTDDASHLASHAWAEAWVNNAWHSFDISNQCSAGEHHIELAYGLDYLDACPIRGSRIGGGQEQLFVVSLVTGQ